MTDADLTPALKDVILLAARRLTGYDRRAFQAEMALRYCGGTPRQAEQVFGWGRDAVNTGLGERRTGIRGLDNFTARGRHKTEEADPGLVAQMHALAEPHSQADPTFQTPRAYTRITARRVHQHLVANAAGTDRPVPAERTVGDILNRLGYHLRRVRKTVPKERCPQPTPSSTTGATHTAAQADPETLRISIDTQAKVKVGPFSRGGSARGTDAVRAADHDLRLDAILAPAGILEVERGQRNLIFGTSRDTSDFVADALDRWWADRSTGYPRVRRLLIDLDNGPSVAGSRTQFIKRLVEFADRSGLTLELAYDPPYHRKDNRIERCWGVLENHGNGTLLTTVATVLEWAKTMTWRGIHLVHRLDRVYNTGVRLTKAAFRPIAARLERSTTLPKWRTAKS